MPTLDFCCAAGCGVVAAGQGSGVRHWDTVSGTAPSVETTLVRRPGRSAYRWTTVGAAATRRLQHNLSASRAAGRIAFYFVTLPDVDTTIVGWGATAGGAPYLKYRTATTDVIPIVGSITTGATAFVITTGIWYIVDLECDLSTGTRVCRAKIRPDWGVTTDLGTASSSVAASTVVTFRIGVGVDATVTAADCLVTDIAHSVTAGDYPIGDGVGATLRPTRDGTHSFNAVTDFKYNNSSNMGSTSPTDTYTYLDEALDNITDFLAAAGVAAGEYLEWGFAPMPVTTYINGVHLTQAYHAEGTAANKATLRLVDGGTVVDVYTDFDVSETSLTFYSVHYPTAPSGGGWTKAKVDALLARWGSSWTAVDISPIPDIDGLVVEVDYVPDLTLPRVPLGPGSRPGARGLRSAA